MKSSTLSWAGSILLHALILSALFFFGKKMDEPVQINLVDFAILEPFKQEPAKSTHGLPPAVNSSPKPASPPAPKPQKPKPAPVKQPAPEPVTTPPPQPVIVKENPAAADEPPPPTEHVAPAGADGLALDNLPPPAAGPHAPRQGTSQATGSDTQGAHERYLTTHFSYIRERVMTLLRYPMLARKRGWSGQARVSFVICEDGSIEDLHLEKSSGHRLLDKNALATVERACPFPKPPGRAAVTLPITYRLN